MTQHWDVLKKSDGSLAYQSDNTNEDGTPAELGLFPFSDYAYVPSATWVDPAPAPIYIGAYSLYKRIPPSTMAGIVGAAATGNYVAQAFNDRLAKEISGGGQFDLIDASDTGVTVAMNEFVSLGIMTEGQRLVVLNTQLLDGETP